MLKKNWNFGWDFCADGQEVKRVNLPYDAMIHEERIKRLKDGSNTGYYPGGKYTYTKMLSCTDEMLKKNVILEFEGVYQKSTVYLNGAVVGGRIYGFSRFHVDLTGKLLPGENEIKVIADNTQMMNCRWYSGSGIYRDVNLYIGDQYHINLDGVVVKTKSIQPAVLSVDVDAEMTDAMRVVTEVSYCGQLVATAEGSVCEISIPDAKLWDAETPNLYDVTVKLMDGKTCIDEYKEKTGIREVTFDAHYGMRVNGKATKLRGACIHHDHGPLGANSFKKAETRRVRTLKKTGFNAIRTAHNPFSRAFLEACDEEGIYVMHETFDTWRAKKSDYDYGLYFDQEWEKDVTDMVLMSRNHPSVILYGIGNEIFETGKPEGAKINQELTEKCKQLDPTRAVINCLNPLCTALGSMNVGINSSKTSPDDIGDPRPEAADTSAAGSKLVNNLVTLMPLLMKLLGSPKKMIKVSKEIFEKVDVIGFNYSSYLLEPLHKHNPNWVMVGSETYAHNIAKNWGMVEEYPFLLGDFCWTGWDYLGETGVGLPLYGVSKGDFSKPYPCVSAGCGSVDLIGTICAQAHFSEAVWKLTKNPFIGVRPVHHVGEKVFLGQWRGTDTVHSWSWKGMEGHASEIEVFSCGDTVELLQDKTSLGKKKVNNYKALFKNTYRPGELTAIAYDRNGKEIGRSSLRTAEKKTILGVVPESAEIAADGMDLLYVNINICDKNGIVKMLEDKKVTIQVEGAGELLAVGSGKVDTTETFTGNAYTTHEGRMIAVIRSNGQVGKIKVTATAPGLDSACCLVLAK